MTLLVFGRGGQVAEALARHGDVTCLGREEADLGDPAACAAAIARVRPAAVINAAAYTAVDLAETEADQAMIVNAEAPGAMARACAMQAIPFVQLSTDYVFGGSGDKPWAPTDETGPINSYGRSKLAGEEQVRAAGGVHAIVRTSWIFSATGHNFVRTILRLSAERDELAIVGDQVGGPTPARALAAACIRIADGLASGAAEGGTFHFSGAPDVSWAQFAQAIVDGAGRTTRIRAIPSAEYPTPAPRPRNSRLDCAGLRAAFGIERPDWREGLGEVLADLGCRPG